MNKDQVEDKEALESELTILKQLVKIETKLARKCL